MILHLLDIYDQLVLTDNSTTANLISNPDVAFSKLTSTIAQNGVLIFNDFVATA